MKKLLWLGVVLSLLALAGCGVPSSPPGSPPGSPPQCSLRVLSRCTECRGWVYFQGAKTGLYLWPWGEVEIGGIPCGDVVHVYLVDDAGRQSHTIYVRVTEPVVCAVFEHFW